MFFLDYCVNTFDRLQKKNYGLLLNILHKPEKEEDVLRNCQIVYLLSHSKIANAADR